MSRFTPGAHMPPRPIVAAVVVAWLATVVWLASERWGQGPRTGQPPALVVDLADEVAPQHAAWHLYRGEQRIGTAETHMAPRKDGQFDLTTRLRDLDLDSGAAQLRVSLVPIIRTVSRDGALVSLDARATIQPNPGEPDRKVEAALKGHAVGDEFRLTCEFNAGGTMGARPLEPIRLGTANAFSPFEPLQKYPPLRPGQSWRASIVDPVGELLNAARPAVARFAGEAHVAPLPGRRPSTGLAARVRDRTEELVTARGQTRTCWVIVFEADGEVARAWVDVADGRVLRQEVNGLGETIAFVRN